MAGKPSFAPWHATCDEAVTDGLTPSEAAWRTLKAFPDVSFTAARFRAQRCKRRLTTATPSVDRAVPSARADDASHVVESAPADRIVSLEELLTVAKVDRSVWTVERYVVNKWEVGTKGPDGKPVVSPLFQVKAWLARRVPESLALLKDALIADIRAECAAPVAGRIVPALGTPESRHMLEVSAFDLHFGKLSWREEAGEDYDLAIARQCFEAAIEDLIAKASGFALQRILLPIGNDLLQSDNLSGTTTSGTQVDTDSRYHKAFRAARASLAWAIHRLATIAPVVVIVVPGNHDRLTAFHMGEVLAAQFASDPSVTVDNSPKLRKYVTFGVNLLGFTHGSEEKHADLPLIMAREEPEAWSKALHYEWHVGHLHRAKETRYTAGDSFNGVRVRILPSLCAADAWHFQKGFVGERRSAEGYLWNFATGYAGHLASNVLPPAVTPKAA